MNSEVKEKEALLPLPKVLAVSGLKKTTIYEMMRTGEFPKSIPLRDCGRRVGWIESQVQAWVQQRIDKARNAKSI